MRVMEKALVLAAGLGSRIRSVAGDLPKPLMRFAGAPILAHNLRWLAAGGVRQVWINLHYGADLVRETIGDGSAFGLEIRYVFEPELLGTAGALANIAAAVTEPMLVVYGDNLVRCDLAALARARQEQDAWAALALFDRDRHPHTGIAGGRVELAAGGRIRAFTEGGASTSSLVNAGVYVVSPAILELIPKGRSVDFGRDVFPAMLDQGRPLTGWVIDQAGFCLGLDTPESHAAGAALIEAGRVAL
ncbi:MAG: nucleotidyltransferase family protein [Caulobacteraceae bacterium]|nr:nucleotidyltransferase family protein [Caulobacteraceae bacterium]